MHVTHALKYDAEFQTPSQGGYKITTNEIGKVLDIRL